MANTIIRAPRRNRYLVLDQCIIDDMRLSWAARLDSDQFSCHYVDDIARARKEMRIMS